MSPLPPDPSAEPLPPASSGEPRSRARGSSHRAVLPLVPGFERPPPRSRPLPDAAAVRLVVVPESAPPYDDDPATPAATGHDAPRPLALVTPSGSPGVPSPTSPGPPARGQAARGQAARGQAARGQAARGQAAAPGWPSQFAQVLAETLAGTRPPGQIAPWTTDQARRRIRQLGPMLAAGVQPRVRRIVTSWPAAGVVEMTVIVRFGPRVRALALRLERDGPHRASPGRDARTARWICTVIEAA